MLEELSNQAGVLVNWVMEMKTISSNPYTNGLNVEKMLDDLQGYASDLVKKVEALKVELQPEAESSEAKSASVKK